MRNDLPDIVHVDQRTDRDGNQWTRTANAKPWRGLGGINLTDAELDERGPLTDTSYDVRRREGSRDGLGAECVGCGHSNNWHQPGDMCVVRVAQGSDERCGCTYVSPAADQVSTGSRPSCAEGGDVR